MFLWYSWREGIHSYLQTNRMEPCSDNAILLLLRPHVDTNSSAWDTLNTTDPCVNQVNFTSTGGPHNTPVYQGPQHTVGRDMYAYLTPFIIVFGVVGNLTSLRIFTLKSMRGLSASMYLAAISVSDLLVLLTYVLLEWLSRGLDNWPGGHSLHIIHSQGVCQVFLLLSYTFRFTSVWLITIFTIERYIAINKPLHRRVLCTRTFSRRLLAGTFLTALLISLYKPFMSGINQTPSGPICGSLQSLQRTNFYLDAVYGFVITLIPFFLISVFNGIILHTLLRKDKRQPEVKMFVKENRLRLEFTVILLAISTSFICLNLPYFIVWIQQFLLAHNQRQSQLLEEPGVEVGQSKSDLLLLTKTIFYLNYCINIFLYALTGKQYRSHLRSLICFWKNNDDEDTPVRSMHTLHTMDSASSGMSKPTYV